MQSKGVEFKVNMNTQQINAEFAKIQQKIKEISQASGFSNKASQVFGEGSGMSKESQRIFQGQQSEELKFLRNKFNDLQKIKKQEEDNFSVIQKNLQNEKQSEQEKKRLLDEQLKIRERLVNIQKQQVNIGASARGIDPSLSGFSGGSLVGQHSPYSPKTSPWTPQDYSKASGPLDWSGVMGGGGGASGGMVKGIISMIGVGAIAQAISGSAKEVAKTFFEHNQDVSRAEGRITTGMASAMGIDSMMNGRGIETHYYAQERMKALGLAQESLGGLTARGLGGMGASMAVGGGAGAYLGAKVGLLGGVFAPITSTAGAIAGGTIGALGAGGASLLSGQSGAGLRSWVNGEGFGTGVDRFRSEHMLNNFTQNFEAEKSKNFFKNQALSYFEGNRGNFTNLQQMSGMGDDSLMNFMGAEGGLFTTADKSSAMSGIASAGGSSAQMRSATDALRLKRDYGLQSANAMVGSLSGMLGGGQTGSDAVVRRVLADAFSLGLDSSKFGKETGNFSREVEKFTSISTRFIEQSGATSIEGMDRVARSMGNSFIGNSMQEINATQFGRGYVDQKLGSGGSEYAKALQMTAFKGDSQLSNLNIEQMISLSNMDTTKLRAGGPEVEAMAKNAGFDNVDDFVIAAEKAKGFGLTPTSKVEEQRQFLSKESSRLGVNAMNPTQLKQAIEQEKDPSRRAELEILSQRSGEFISTMKTYDSSLTDKTSSELLSAGSSMVNFGKTTIPDLLAPTRETTGMERGEMAQARSEQLKLESVASGFDKYVESANQTIATTARIQEAFVNFINAVEKKAGNIEAITKTLVDAQATENTNNANQANQPFMYFMNPSQKE